MIRREEDRVHGDNPTVANVRPHNLRFPNLLSTLTAAKLVEFFIPVGTPISFHRSLSFTCLSVTFFDETFGQYQLFFSRCIILWSALTEQIAS